jgi:hypothetical protein
MFVRGPNPIWFMSNLTGSPLDDTYYAFFLTNDLPYIPQIVYEDPNGVVAWINPIEFQPSSGLPNNLYFDPTLTYRIEIRQGPTQADPLIWLVQNYVVSGEGGGAEVIADPLIVSSNMITNPQFADINFTSPLTITTAGTYNIAPGWELILTGSGSMTITQGTNSGSSDIIGNPIYYLEFASSMWTTAILQQTFNNNGAIFSGGAIAVAYTATASTSSALLGVNYVPGTGSGIPIDLRNIPTGEFVAYKNAVDIPSDGTNTATGPNAHVNIQFNLPVDGNISLSNIQITGQSTPLSAGFEDNPTPPSYQEQSYPRTLDQEFNVYKPELAYKPTPSYLVGWDFPLNPAQFSGRSIAPQAVGANKSYYAWDQTILFQSSNSGITVSNGSSNDLTLTAAVNTQMAVIQYLDQTQARKILNDQICVNLSAAVPSNIVCTISLWYTKDGSLPSTVGSNNSLVASLDSKGKPATFNGNWIEVPRNNLQNATFTVMDSVAGNTTFNDYNYNGWNLEGIADVNLATFFAIVIGTETVISTNSLRINSVGLMNGSIATRPAPQTEDEVLRQCQYYYEKSYSSAIAPGTATSTGQRFLPAPITMGSPSDVLRTRSFSLVYNTTKNISPNVTFYSPATGTAAVVHMVINFVGGSPTGSDIAISDWTATGQSLAGLNMIATSPGAGIGAATSASNEGQLIYHYVADSRMGL